MGPSDLINSQSLKMRKVMVIAFTKYITSNVEAYFILIFFPFKIYNSGLNFPFGNFAVQFNAGTTLTVV